MPSELELGRVANNIQDLLYAASDLSHDRCVKVLMARAKVSKHGPQDPYRGPRTPTGAPGPTHGPQDPVPATHHLGEFYWAPPDEGRWGDIRNPVYCKSCPVAQCAPCGPPPRAQRGQTLTARGGCSNQPPRAAL